MSTLPLENWSALGGINSTSRSAGWADYINEGCAKEPYATMPQFLTDRRELTRVPKLDPATGLGNTALFWNEGGKAIARYRRTGDPFSVVLLLISEELSGDPLRNTVMAEMLAKAVRQEDTPCYLYGRWFGVVLAGAGQEGAERARERIRTAGAWRPGRPLSVTPTGGVAAWSSEYEGFEQLLADAIEDLRANGGIHEDQLAEWGRPRRRVM